ncbi:hypothetical protein [Tenacibaculum phage Larrie]|nr:hypothetical protein [Tenacibaculum phage Larrie]
MTETKEQILARMEDIMPFTYSEKVRPYILEAMQIHADKQLILSGVVSSAYTVKVEGKGTIIILAESIADACDKLESKGYKNYAFVKSTSLDVVF